MFYVDSIFSRKAVLIIFLAYEQNGLELPVSSAYLSSAYSSPLWSLYLSTLETLLYPLGVNIYDFAYMLEEGSASPLNPSSVFMPVIHSRKKLLGVIQRMMREDTGSERCRAEMARRMGRERSGVNVDFRSKAGTITMHKVEEYAAAAGLKVSDVFRRYAELYPEDADYERYPGTSSGL